MRSLHIDIETYCEVDLKKAGAYRYAEEVELILFGYKYDDGPVQCLDVLQGERISNQILADLINPDVKKKAFNAAFEISQLESILGIELPVEQWECTAARTAMCGLPLNLEQAAAVLNLENQKDRSGYNLIRYFCIPCKPTKSNGMRTRNLPEHDPVKWKQFIEYCKKDVEAEWSLSRKLSFYHISEFEHRQWCLDMKINKRGVGINIPFVRNAISLINHYEDRLLMEARQLTGLQNPKSVAQLKKWLFEETEEEITSLNKETIPAILKKTGSETVRRVLEIRQESSKTSTKKYPRMLQCICSDGRIRGVHQYYGANRTGRVASRLIQTQNLPRGSFKNIEPVRDLVMKHDPDWLEFSYGPIPDTLSSLLRSSIVPATGKRFIICDYSAIEAVVLAWLAGEEWMLEVFRTHGKLYEMSASKMFNIPMEQITKDSPYRQKGKLTELSCGYGGSDGALIKMGALKEGILESELPSMVKGYRMTHINVVALWQAFNQAAMQTIQSGNKTYVHDMYVNTLYIKGDVIEIDWFAPNHGIYFYMKGPSMFMVLPSGRELVYINARIEDGEYGPRITYWGVDQTKKKWAKQDTYGPKLVENADQAIARDILMNGLQNLDAADYHTILQVHDEAVCEEEIGFGSLEEVSKLMLELPDWAAGLPLKAAGEESFYYKK